VNAVISTAAPDATPVSVQVVGSFSEGAVGTTAGLEAQTTVRAAVEKTVRPLVRQKVL
jgi:hypothetical protein